MPTPVIACCIVLPTPPNEGNPPKETVLGLFAGNDYRLELVVWRWISFE